MIPIEDFKKQKDCTYKSEKYSVRDNGAVLRHPRENKPIRKLDNQWLFGNPNKDGYLLIATEVVHRIVATAFHGEAPTDQHVVDHIDTNKQNNRPENLRWLTKLENILNNPFTRKKIIFRCGSIEEFLKDPSILKNHENDDSNFKWMKTVTPDEAQNAWERLNNWLNTKNQKVNSISGSLGDWIFKPKKKTDKERLEIEQSNPEKTQELVENVLKMIEEETGLTREELSSKSKKKDLLIARVYAAVRLRKEIDLSEVSISQLIGVSKSMVNTYLNYSQSYLKNSKFSNLS